MPFTKTYAQSEMARASTARCSTNRTVVPSRASDDPGYGQHLALAPSPSSLERSPRSSDGDAPATAGHADQVAAAKRQPTAFLQLGHLGKGSPTTTVTRSSSGHSLR